jgi:hypothetical protein
VVLYGSAMTGMITFALLNALMGAALGMRFKVGALFLDMIFSAFIVVGVSVAAGNASLQTVFLLIVGMTSLQFGYVLNVIGCVSREQRAVAVDAIGKKDAVMTAFNELDDLIADLTTVSSRARAERQQDFVPRQKRA